MHAALAVGLVFGGCCSNVVFLELLIREFPGSGNLITFSQFFFIALEGFIFEAKFGRKQPTIPIRFYLIMVGMFFTVSVVNNYALNLNIAMPLHMIFRSGSLIASMALGIIILKKRYTLSKYISIALVSLGIFTCTLMSAKEVYHLILRVKRKKENGCISNCCQSNSVDGQPVAANKILPSLVEIMRTRSKRREEEESQSRTFRRRNLSAKSSVSGASEDAESISAFLWWLLGIAALTFALLMSALMGIFQETIYKKFGKHSKEALFYNHGLPLPGFLFLAPDIYRHGLLFSQSRLVQVPLVGLSLPIMWLYLMMNVITQYICIRGVFTLTTECTSLTVTLVVTLRKFVSLIFSILYFRNPFTVWHWLGTFLVFLGMLLYTEVWKNLGLVRPCGPRKVEKKQE